MVVPIGNSKNWIHFVGALSILTIVSLFRSSQTILEEDVSFSRSFDDPAINPELSNLPKHAIYYRNGAPKALPKFEAGGVMIFYHTFKSGGSTTREFMADQMYDDDDGVEDDDNNVDSSSDDDKRIGPPGRDTSFSFMTFRKEINWFSCERAIQKASEEGRRVLYEFHIEYPAPRFPTLVELAPWLDKCRATAERQGVPFFAFTLLREPVAHSLSFFNFFHVAIKQKTTWNPFHSAMEPTEESFLETFQGNRQCHMLDRDAEGLFKAPLAALKDPNDPSLLRQRETINDGDMDESMYYKRCRIDAVRKALFESLDWVGTTDALSNSTLPLLSSILVNDPKVGQERESFKVFTDRYSDHTGLTKEDLSGKALERVRHETRFDRQLFREAQKMFRYTYP